jgi:hypothetical protein
MGPPKQVLNSGKGPGRETDHSPPASAEIKKICIYTSTPPYALAQGQLYLCLKDIDKITNLGPYP